MNNSVKAHATQNTTELGLDDLETISGGMTPEVAAQLNNVTMGVLKFERATSVKEQIRIACDISLATIKLQNLLNSAEKNPMK